MIGSHKIKFSHARLTFLELVISLGAVRGDHQGEAGRGGGVRGTRAWSVHLTPVGRAQPQLEPDQQLALGIIIEAVTRLVAAQPPAPLDRDEGDDVLLAKLNVINTNVFSRLPFRRKLFRDS